MKLDALPFIQAKNYTPADRTKVDLIVLHSMESQEKPGTARNVAKWFGGPIPPRASAHYCIDNAEIVRCLRDEDIGWHAPGANSNGIGIEHAGRASQTTVEWSDAYSRSMLALSVELCARLCLKWGIPAKLVTMEGLLRKERGITIHAAVSKAFKKSTHTDPGPGFPLTWYIKEVERIKSGLTAANEGGES